MLSPPFLFHHARQSTSLSSTWAASFECKFRRLTEFGTLRQSCQGLFGTRSVTDRLNSETLPKCFLSQRRLAIKWKILLGSGLWIPIFAHATDWFALFISSIVCQDEKLSFFSVMSPAWPISASDSELKIINRRIETLEFRRANLGRSR